MSNRKRHARRSEGRELVLEEGKGSGVIAGCRVDGRVRIKRRFRTRRRARSKKMGTGIGGTRELLQGGTCGMGCVFLRAS